MTTQPAQRRTHPALSVAISITIVLAVFVIGPAIGGAVAEWMVNG